MSATSPLHQYAHRRFREVFGEPDHTLERDDHWALKPGPNSITINVLVNGTAENPAVWVFDPHSKNDGVLRKLIHNEDDLNDLIKQIQERVKQAAQATQAAKPSRPKNA
jgi:hypothetical protein